MLDNLRIQNIGVITNAEISPSSGLTVITGETGAGKSMLLSALTLLAGKSHERINALKDNLTEDINVDSIWHTVPHGAYDKVFDATGVKIEDDDLIISRTITAESKRSRCSVQAKAVPASVLVDLSTDLVQIHGQADHLKLKNGAKVLELIDEIVMLSDGSQQIFSDYRTAFAQVNALRNEFKALSNEVADAAKNEEYYRFAISQIEAVSPTENEDELLAAKIKGATENADQAGKISEILQLINGADNDFGSGESLGVLAALREIEGRIAGVLEESEAETLSAQILCLYDELSTVSASLNSRIDPELSEVNINALYERKSQLDSLLKSWGPRISDVLAFYELAKDSLDGNIGNNLARIESELKMAEKNLIECGARITGLREQVAIKFSEQVVNQLEKLNFNDAKIEFKWTALEQLSANGADNVELLFSPHSSVSAAPIDKVASGGELSRIMLAIEFVRSTMVLQAKENSILPLLVFDEVDAGIGGQTANIVASLLSEVAKSTQIIVVTHLATVAAKADRHYVISKTPSISGEEATIAEVKGEAREVEIARMLSGTASETALQHAKEMLLNSQND